MPVSPARNLAYRILLRVESGRRFASDLLHQPAAHQISPVDRRLATELVMGVLRWRGELDFVLGQLSGKALGYFDREVATVLRLGIYQIRFLAKVPKSAVVHEAVEMVKAARRRSAAGLVNAVLRKCDAPTIRLRAEAGERLEGEGLESACRSVPEWLLERWTRRFGLEQAKALAGATVHVPPTTLRVAHPGERQSVERRLREEGIRVREGRYGVDSLVVESGDLSSSKVIREGEAIVQDEASQLVGALVAPKPGHAVLDLCAAPGIKAGQLAAVLGRGRLVACDLNPHRLRTMARLLRRTIPLSLACDVVRLDATRALPFSSEFDRILVDAPCSGTGTLARNPEIKLRLRAHDLDRLARIQTQLLHNALRALAKGGRLVYTTCSLEPEENEEVVEKALGQCPRCRHLSSEELVDEFPSVGPFLDARGYFRTRPDLHSMDGFFAALIVRDL